MPSKTVSATALTLCLSLLAAELMGQEFRYQADWDSIRSHYRCPTWFRDAKFGVFVFWGPASVPQVGNDKYGKWMYTKNYVPNGVDCRRYHEAHFGHQSVFGYKDFFPLFRMEKFDADEWAALFEESGARYIVPVAEMHDGYAMYASRHTRWNVVDVGPERDVMRLLVDAARARDIKVGMSSHFAWNRAFYPKWDPSFDTNDPEFRDLYGEAVRSDDPPTQAFLDRWWDRTTDIVDQYEPDILWFDFGLDSPGFESVHKKIMAYYYNRGLEWDRGVVLQDKNMRYESFPEDLMVLDIERGRRSEASEHPWQTDTAVGKVSWTWIINENYKSSEFLIDELVDIVSKNGNLLLSIGPKPDGTIGEAEASILRDIGSWLRLNGEAIYGTRPWKIYGEGPAKFAQGETEFKNKHHTEHTDVASTAADIRFTAKGDRLYATSLAWPDDGVFRIKTLRTGNLYEQRPVATVAFLSGTEEVDWTQSEEELSIRVASDPPCEAAYVFRITFAAE
ncbi:alpha-L-fucosidase [Botrimarina hoheduenensis]|uniref:alpha-L-fucosidase n=1 Tax=Botrimarina hoheduenensis TaxID=2528000 RepID=A0A5C5VPU3_9BACT|nr:alpha-L-fucosidase [Botrimarina hoheduenensis]TWT40626.1 Alpha-L-fucosidase [Botrimarina hoheduenensis]